MKNRRILKFLFVSLIVLLISGCSNNETDIRTILNDNDKLIIHYIDVGQGDSIFIELPNKEVMLIDAGEKQYGDTVKNYITSLGYDEINYIVGTHPHSDHIGGMKDIIESFKIDNIYMPKASNTSDTYINLLEAIDKKGNTITTAKNGVDIMNTDNLKIQIVAPNSDSYSDLNNYSAVVKITYINRSFLFMGDAEVKSEEEITSDIDVDVVKVGHHGSDSSSGINFVKKTSPKYAIVSVGSGNKYNHPYQSIIERWESIGATVYRTDIEGTITLTSDGDAIKISSEKNSELENVESIDNDNSNDKDKDSNIQLVSLSEIIKGNDATIKVKGLNNTKYSIKVMYKSGPSTAEGLEDKTSDDNGTVEWTWKVSNNVKSGNYTIIISDDNGNTNTFDYELK